MVVAIRRLAEGRGTVMLPNPTEPLRPDDILVVVSSPAAVERLASRTRS
jgi:Trk K+ transport system NAD-binding subunit